MPGGKVLVLGDDTRAFLTTVRSLGRQGIAVHAAPANFRSPALRSRYIAEIHDVPPWMGDGAEWIATVEPLLRSHRFDLVIPCDETSLLPLQHCRQRLAALARLAIPDDDAIAILFDKHETRKLARRAGVPVAAGRLLRPDDTAVEVLAEFGAPVVVKPRRSYSLASLSSRGKVQVASDPALLARLLSAAPPKQTILEEFFPGTGMGVSLLASEGRVLQAFEHHRVHETAGASFYRVSAPLTPALARACEAVVAALRYTGLAMFEFKRNQDGAWILLEINARPWGSLPLPVALGVDFPYRWYQLLVEGRETPAVAYRVGVYGRNLVPDVLASLTEAKKLRMGRFATARFATSRGAELLRPLIGREKHDLLAHDDPRPGLAELTGLTEAVRERVYRVLAGGGSRRQRARARVAKALKGAEHPVVLFVCHGNICRSPFAEALFRARLGNIPMKIESAGLLPQPGRPTPELGRQAAAAYGIDLSSHRSRWLRREDAEAAALLVIFDENNRATLLARYPKIATPVVGLGELSNLEGIPDPIDGGLQEFRCVYDRIAVAIGDLVVLAQGAHA